MLGRVSSLASTLLHYFALLNQYGKSPMIKAQRRRIIFRQWGRSSFTHKHIKPGLGSWLTYTVSLTLSCAGDPFGPKDNNKMI